MVIDMAIVVSHRLRHKAEEEAADSGGLNFDGLNFFDDYWTAGLETAGRLLAEFDAGYVGKGPAGVRLEDGVAFWVELAAVPAEVVVDLFSAFLDLLKNMIKVEALYQQRKYGKMTRQMVESHFIQVLDSLSEDNLKDRAAKMASDQSMETGEVFLTWTCLQEKIGYWLNFNSFVARHYGTGFPRGLNFAVWEIRHGLEETLQERPTKDGRQDLEFQISHDVEQLLDEPKRGIDKRAESQPSPLGPEGTHRVAVAAEWLIHASPILLREALSWGSRPLLDDLDRRVFCSGSLFSGDPGLDLERWGFWKRRLNGLRGRLGNGEETRQRVEEAVASMSAAECAAAQQL
ncbi:hypothetical protein CKAH01_05689 [Colletotrichum kahawae]|uniref:Uncharacterized protein n=1 Tax=Colletotrichum kahawae TaxID=34407 RepID=A0AAD9YDU8_COLKA|nr:hypothetical protein CKAH01_05689 [Colletotrichum kahawae]